MWNFSSQGIRAPSRHHETGDWWFRRPGGFPESGSPDVGLLRLLRADHRRVGLSAARRDPLHQLSGPDSELYRRPRMVSSLTRSRGQFETRGPWFESGTDTSPQCFSKDKIQNPKSVASTDFAISDGFYKKNFLGQLNHKIYSLSRNLFRVLYKLFSCWHHLAPNVWIKHESVSTKL